MSGGFVSGVFWGVVVSATCLVIASQSDKVVDLSPEPMAADEAPMEEAGAEAMDSEAMEASPADAESGMADAPSGDGAEAPADEPAEASSDEPADTPAVEPAETSPGDAVEAPAMEPAETSPGYAADAPVSDTTGAEPADASEPAADATTEDAVETEPAPEQETTPPAEDAEEESRIDGPDSVVDTEEGADVASDTPAEAPVEVASEEASSPAVEETAQGTPEEAASDVPKPAAALAGLETDVEADTDAPPVIVLDAPNTLREPDGEIGNLAPNVTTNRLPRIGAQEEPSSEAEAPAIDRNAVPFEAAPGTPLLAIVLIDPGAGRPDPQVLREFPVPLSVAVDPLQPDAGEVAARYRAAGLEVAVLTPLANGATPADVAVAFDVFLSTVPQAVAVMDLPEALLQDGRPRASQVATTLARTGHGLITYDSGFNSGIQIAEGEGIPAGLVFRVFDDGTQDLAAMRTALDNSVLGAGQQGAAILVGQARAETLQAVAEWALGTRGASVTPAPVSAVLKN